ncbi:MAG: TonB-dependent siderophore receptor [Gammaproteobacteria bacterium]|nr:TonB-dependent siderophore receptor [Gammaproteobacteria bacterium]
MKARTLPHLFFSAILLTSSLTLAEASANADAIEEIVVTGKLSRFGATRSTTPILETSRSVNVIRESVFRSRGALTLDDTLSYTAGVVGDTYGFSTRGDFPRVRGFNAAEYRDGQQVLFGYYNNTRSDVYMLEQVEVLKGPASVLYGKGTPGGIVNAISKIARPGSDNEVLLDIGEHDRYQAAADISFQWSDHLYARLVGVYRDSDTQVDFVQDEAIVVMPSITWQNERTTLTLLYEHADRDSDTAHQFLPLTGTACATGKVRVAPTSTCANATGVEIDAATYMGEPGFNRFNTDSTLVSLLGSHNFNKRFSIEGVARHKDGKADYHQSWLDFAGAGNPRTNAAGDAGRTFYSSAADSEQLALDLRARLDFDTGKLNHELFLGAVYQDVETDNDTIYLSGQGTLNIYNPAYGNLPSAFTDGTPFYDAPQATTEDLGWYLNDQISVDRWRINLGARIDHTQTRRGDGDRQKDNEASFSAGVLYALDIGLAPYVNWAESFETVVGVNSVTGDFLKPRRGEQVEAGIKYQPPGSRIYVTMAYFDIEESNLPNPASLITSPDQQQEGIGEVRGFEVEAQTRMGDWHLQGAFSLLDTESADGVPFASIPERQLSGWIQYQPSEGALRGFRFGLGLRHASENESNAVASGVRVKTHGHTVADLLLGYEAAHWEASLNLRNVTDADYYGTCLARGDCFPGEERGLVGRIRFKI